MMNNRYDVIVVGAGPTGIFTCYELTLKLPGARVLLVDKGHDIYKRNCPILQKKIEKCPPPVGKKIMRDVYLPVRLQTDLEEREHIRTVSLTLRASLVGG